MWRRSLSNHGDTRLAPIPATFLMTPFEFVTVAVSFILGLGVTQLLSAAITTFRARHRLHLEWLPLLWALSIFLWMFQFWWAIYELASIFDSWTTSRFVTVLSMAMLLFTAGALVLPAYDTGETRSLAETFQTDGRWALVFLSSYFGVSLIVNLLWWNVPVLSFLGVMVTALMILPLVSLAVRGRHAQLACAWLYVALSVWAAIALSPSQY